MNQQLFNIELYYTPSKNISGNKLTIDGEEYSHISRVMRHNLGDEIYVTDGEGMIYLGKIIQINKKNLEISISEILNFDSKLKNIFFCIPKLRSTDRFEFALEKCTELGIINFIVFESERSISRSSRMERWNKILLSAMKQSLNSYLPYIKEVYFDNIFKFEGIKIGFEQTSRRPFSNFKINPEEKLYFVFGPEGGLSKKELSLFEEENLYQITNNRLRSETAVITCASIVSSC